MRVYPGAAQNNAERQPRHAAADNQDIGIGGFFLRDLFVLMPGNIDLFSKGKQGYIEVFNFINLRVSVFICGKK